MPVVLYIYNLFLFILSFSYPVCTDRIININNVHQEFLIDNVDGIGLIKFDSNFKKVLKSDIKSETANGQDIYARFIAYACFDIDHIANCIVHCLTIHMQYPNVQAGALTDYHKALLSIIQSIKF